MAGTALPISYRDCRDESARHGDHADRVFDMLQAMDTEFMRLAAAQSESLKTK